MHNHSSTAQTDLLIDELIRATVSPTIAIGMINGGLHWWLFYYTLASSSALELVGSVALLWRENAQQFHINNPNTGGSGNGTRTVEAVKNQVTWVMAPFLFTYMGVEGASDGEGSHT